MHKERDYSKPGTVSKSIMICDCSENFSNKIAIITDDMIDSGGTFVKACETLIKKGFKEVIGVITHGYFTSNALDKIINCKYIIKIIVTNSICQDSKIKICKKIDLIDLSAQLGKQLKEFIMKVVYLIYFNFLFFLVLILFFKNIFSFTSGY